MTIIRSTPLVQQTFTCIIGLSGSGKSTFARVLSLRYKETVLSVGTLARNRWKYQVWDGKLAPEQEIRGMIKEKISRMNPNIRVTFDGFPRNFLQLIWLNQTYPNAEIRLLNNRVGVFYELI